MLTITRTLAGCFLALLFCVRAFAQTDQPIDAPPEPKQPPAQASIIITATASSQRVRSVALGEVNQTRLQVFSADGSPIFDSQFRLGNLVDWQLVDQHGQPLTDGSYLFLVTVKDFSGHLTQKYGTAVLEQEQVSLGQAARDELPQSLAVALEANKLSDTLSTVDRVGVAATARATTIPTDSTTIDTVTDGQRTKTKQATTGGENIGGTGTQNVIAKWIDNAGTLGNSTISEVNGQVGIGTNNPGGQLHIFGTATQDVFAGMGPDLTNGPAFNFGYAASSFGRGAGFFNVRPDASATAPNPSLRFATANVQQMIITNTGNVGIGNLGPTFKLHVVDTANTGLRVQTNTGGGTVASFGGNGDFQIDARNIVGGRLTVQEAGNIGVGTAAPQAKLDVRGDVRIMAGATLYLMGTPAEVVQGPSGIVPLCLSENAGSDGEVLRCPASSSFRYKTNIRPFAGGLEIINHLRPITFTWKQYGFKDVGFGAEDVEKVAPLLTFRNAKGEIEGVKYDRLSVLFVNAFKEQQAEINQQQQAIKRLREELWRLQIASRRHRQKWGR